MEALWVLWVKTEALLILEKSREKTTHKM